MPEKHVSCSVQLPSEICRSAQIWMYALHQAIIRRADVLLRRPRSYPEDFKGLSDTLIAGRNVATILFLAPPSALPLNSLPPAFLFRLLAPPRVSYLGAASKQAREYSLLFHESRLRGGVSLVRRKLVVTRRLPLVLRQPATTLRVEDPEVVLRFSISLVCGKRIKARGLSIVLQQPATFARLEEREIALRRGASLFGGEFV
jgi:hypothetical protein